MVSNYFKVALRNLWKNRVFTTLNVLGLTVAFCVATLLTIASVDDLSRDQFHVNKNNLYQVYATDQTSKGPEASNSLGTPFLPALKNEVPGISKITRHLEENIVVSHNDKELQLDVSYVDGDFLKLFTFPVLKGETNLALQNKTDIVLTSEAATKIFGTDDVIGQTLLVKQNNENLPFIISAVLNDIPKQSSITFDVLLDFKNNPYYIPTKDRWNTEFHNVYLQLSEGFSPKQFEESTRPFSAKYYAERISNAKRDGIQADNNGQFRQFRLTPFSNSAFTSYEGGIAKVSKIMPYMVLGIALLILFIASVNFINMSIAKSSQRLREIGMRKTLGASKSQLFIQLWIESIFIFLLSLMLGLLLGKALLGEFQTLFRTAGNFATLLRPEILASLLGALLLITIIAGGYPALLLSKLGTLKALKGKMDAQSGNRLRNVLMVVQFSIAILLISGTIVLSKQIDFLRHKDLGFNKDYVVSIPFNGSLRGKVALERLRNKLQNTPEILSVSAADNNLGRGRDGSGYTSMSGFDYEGRGLKTHSLIVDYDYIETLGLELVAGRSFNRNFPGDSLSMIINETMAKEYGKDNPLEVSVIIGDSTRYNVVGVVKDYNFRGLKREVEPLTLFMDSSSDYYYAFAKVDSKNAIAAYDKIETVWKQIEPDAAFLGSFIDENINRTLRREKVLTTIITSGSIIAIILSCIGLFAISMIMVNQRTKEIGIRKIVGASVSEITMLLTSGYLKLIVIAFLIATPVSWWMMNRWLENYAYHIDLNILLFLMAGGIALIIATLTISVKTIRAATVNPAKSIQSE